MTGVREANLFFLVLLSSCAAKKVQSNDRARMLASDPQVTCRIPYVQICQGIAAIPTNNRVEKIYLYRVSKNGKSHYIFGTYHQIFEWDSLPEIVHSVFKPAENIVLETEYPDHARDNNVVSFADFQCKATPGLQLNEAGRRKMCELGLVEKIKRNIREDDCFALTVYPHVEAHPFYSMDSDIYFHAKDAGKNTFALDTPKILKSAPKPPQASPEACSVGDLLNRSSAQQLFDIGQASIDSYRLGSLENSRGKTDPMTVYRNERWIPRLLYIFNRGKTFVAVGAEHLFGPKGIINLLSNRGFVVERIENSVTK